MFYDGNKNLYTGYSTRGELIGVTPADMLNAIKCAVISNQDLNQCLSADSWCYLKRYGEGVVALNQMEDTGYSLEDALFIAGKAILECEEIVYTVKQVSKAERKLRITITQEGCDSLVKTYSNIPVLYAAMQGLEYTNFEVFKNWQPVLP